MLEKYDYQFPKTLIAQSPAKPRDSARLLIHNKKNLQENFDIFSNLGKYLPAKCVLVFNQTKVWPARLPVVKESGGKVKILYISQDKKYIKVLSDKKLKPGTKLFFMGGGGTFFRVMSKKAGFYFLKPSFPVSQTPNVLAKFGLTPLPPYIKHSPLSENQRRKEYQNVFAKNGLSVAAPTAGLHFTKRLMGKLKRQGIDIKFVRLDVNLGTFAPLQEEQIKTGRLHHEIYRIDQSTAKYLNSAKKAGRPIIAVGTTVVRTLESAATKNQELIKLSGSTDLFIREGYKFKFTDGIITNFHVPQSSLLILVSTFAGRQQILDLYKKAINKNFRLFSFGDGLLII